MKSASLPPLRVEPKFRKQVERLLAPGETLSTFVEQAVQELVERRQADEDFGARAMTSRARAKASGRYHSAANVLSALEEQPKKPRDRKK